MNTIAKIGIAVLLVAFVVAGGAFLYLRSVSASSSLANMSTNDATAYRYTSMAQYYAAHPSIASSSESFSIGSGYPISGTGLDTANPIEAMQYRYQALANYYAAHPSATR